jgi:tetratricopeptide (TPR) repeat protein
MLNKSNLKLLCELATVDAPWECCQLGLLTLAGQMTSEQIEERVLQYKEENKSRAIGHSYPDGDWLVHCFQHLDLGPMEVQHFLLMMNEMVKGLEKRKRLDEASKVSEQIIEMLEGKALKQLSDADQKRLNDAPLTDMQLRTTKLHLSTLYRQQGRSDEADKLQKSADLAGPMEDVMVKARSIAREALTKSIASLGFDKASSQAVSALDESTPYGCCHLARQCAESNFVEADRLLQKAISMIEPMLETPISDRSWIPGHAGFIDFHWVVSFYVEHDRFLDAQRWCSASLKMPQRMEMVGVPAVTEFNEYRNCRIQAAILLGLGKISDAEPFLKRALEIAEMGIKPKHLLGQTMNSLWLEKALVDYGIFLEQTGKSEEATACFRRLEGPFEILFGSVQTLSQKRVRQSLGSASRPYRDRLRNPEFGFAVASMFEEPYQLAAKCLDLCKTMIEKKGTALDEVLRLYFLSDSALIYREAGRDEESEEAYKEAISIAERELNTSSKIGTIFDRDDLIDLLRGYSKLLERLGRKTELEEMESKIDRLSSQ